MANECELEFWRPYKHYKGGDYVVIGVAAEPKGLVVLYCELGKLSIVYGREINNFLGFVSNNPRFALSDLEIGLSPYQKQLAVSAKDNYEYKE